MRLVSEPSAGRAVAFWFLLDAYQGVASPPGKGVPHAHAVADILRDSGADEPTQLVGLLHDVVEDTSRTVEDVRATFGDDLAEMVAVLTEDASIENEATRKRLLRQRIAAVGCPVMDVALADKIATLRYVLLTGIPVRKPQLTHYRATLQLALAAGVGGELCVQLAELLVDFR
jgi:(p)ppGpp synthase/HD superfamily hydrolase